MPTPLCRQFVFYIHRPCYWQISFGISIDFRLPNIEIHLPFTFIKIGWDAGWRYSDMKRKQKKTFGKGYDMEKLRLTTKV